MRTNPQKLFPRNWISMSPVISAAVAWLSLASYLPAKVPASLKATRTIDFSEPSGMAYNQHGYQIRGRDNDWIRLFSGGGITATNGGGYLRIGNSGAPITITQADHTAFDLIAMDIAEYSTVAVPKYVEFVGIKSDGTAINWRFTPDLVIDGDGPQEDFESVSFPAGWTDLVSVQITTTAVAIDNIRMRGFDLTSYHAMDSNVPQLAVVGILETYSSYNSWGIVGMEGGKMRLWRQRYTYDPLYHVSFDVTTGQILNTVSISSTTGSSSDMGERAFVIGGKLIWTDGTKSAELAEIGLDNVSSISYPAPGNGRVLFVNHWYLGEEQYAVFLAGPDGVEPIITPDTVLPDGSSPYSFPRETFYTGKSYAISTSTTLAKSLYLISFDSGPLLLSPAAGDSIPGTTLTIKGRPQLKHLNDTSARFTAESEGGNGELLEIAMADDGSWIAYGVEVPAINFKTVLPGYGLLQRHYGSIPFDLGDTQITRGPIECYDLHPNNRNGLVVQTRGKAPQLMIWEGQTVKGFGTISGAYSDAWVQNGIFYTAARNTDGVVALLRGIVPSRSPITYIDQFVPMADGSVRLMVKNLTHGKNYRVERSDSPIGPWLPASSFSAGSPARSVLGNYQYGTREFYRTIEDE